MLALLLVAGCRYGQGARPVAQEPGPRHPAVYSLRITPSYATMTAGGTQQFAVAVLDPLGHPMLLSPSWDATGGTITSGGLYHAGTTAGTFRVIARIAGEELSDVASVTIGAALASDRVTLLLPAQPPAPLPVVLLDANVGGTSPCENDDHHTGDVTFPNWLARGGCPPDEIAAFARGAAARILDGPGGNGRIWSNASGETQTVDLQKGPLAMPVEFWVLDQFYRLLVNGTWQNLSVETAALAAFDHNNDYYNASRAGIRFEPGPTHKVWNSAAAKAALDCITSGAEVLCQCTDTLYSTPFFVPGRLNVYFVDQVYYRDQKVMGVNCRDPDSTTNDPQAGNAILVSSTQMNLATLGHELGHALSLGHTGDAGDSWYDDEATGAPLFDATNLMWSGGEESFTFTLGQAFRMNVETLSQLNANGVRTGPKRACECRASAPGCDFLGESDTDGKCPRISRPW